MNKPTIHAQENYLGAWGVTIIVGSLVIAAVYATLYSEIPNPRSSYGTIFNPAALWFSLWILISGTFAGLLLLGISKCISELSAIRILMNEEAGRTDPEPAQTTPTPEENTYEPQAPDNK